MELAKPEASDMASLSAAAKDWRPGAVALLRLEAALVGLVCFSAGAVPRLLPALLGLLGVIAAIHVFSIDPARPLRLLRSAVGIALLVFNAYLFINAAWSPDRFEGFTKAATVLGLVAAVFLISASYSLREAREARVLAKSALAGLALGIFFLLIEVNFGEPIVRFLTNHVVQLFEITPKKTKVVAGEVTKISAYVLNRNVTSLVLFLVPALLFTSALATANVRRFSLIAVIAATAAIALLSESGTSVVAFFVGALVLALAALSLKATRTLLAVGWTVATLLAVPLSALPYELGWHHWTWLPPESVAARFYIWKYVADKVPEKPITGIGIRGTRALHLVIPADAGDPNNSALALQGRAARHPHNVYLQTWFELGGIGAALLLAVGLAGLWQMRVLPPVLQGASYALFAVSGAVGLSGFDLWQTWLLAALAFAWGAMQLAARLPAPFLLSSAEDRSARSGKAALPLTRA
jgi:O-antigen ligase